MNESYEDGSRLVKRDQNLYESTQTVTEIQLLKEMKLQMLFDERNQVNPGDSAALVSVFSNVFVCSSLSSLSFQ